MKTHVYWPLFLGTRHLLPRVFLNSLAKPVTLFPFYSWDPEAQRPQRECQAASVPTAFRIRGGLSFSASAT